MTTPIIEIADKFLLTSGVTSLPLSLEVLEGAAKRCGWIIETYTAAHDYIAKYNLEEFTHGRDAFTFLIDGQHIIFYNGEAAHQRKIHAICHEMGHIVLRHDLKHIVPIQEWEADVFAEEMISPTCSRARTQLQENLCKQLGIRPHHNFALITILAIFFGVLVVVMLSHGGEFFSADKTVYVTLYGEKYHVDGCYYITNKEHLTALTVSEAERKGYGPCSYCIGKEN